MKKNIIIFLLMFSSALLLCFMGDKGGNLYLTFSLFYLAYILTSLKRK